MYENQYREVEPKYSLIKREELWNIGKGLQKVDGLKTSEYLEGIIKDTLTGKYDTHEAQQKVYEHYAAMDATIFEERTAEADISTARITSYLETGSFRFAPMQLKIIHKTLFEGVLENASWVGTFRDVNTTKPEAILADKTVNYMNWSDIDAYLEYDFDEEKNRRYSNMTAQTQVESIVKFTSNVWQIHPFREGNTRTIATFIIRYLREAGIPTDNEPFKKHAKYFRDALVRANYSDMQSKIQSDSFFLKLFFENLLLGSNHNLEVLDLRCKELF